MFSFLLMVLVLGMVARWVLTAGAGRGDRELEARHTAEIARLREEMDQLQGQVMRLTDEQSFLTRLLAEGERPAGELPPAQASPSEPRPETP